MVHSEKTFQYYSEKLRGVYEENDDNRSLNQMWLRTVHRASELGEAVRESRQEDLSYDKLMPPIADVFCWVNNFVTECNKHENSIYNLDPKLERDIKIKGNPSWLIWEKYPGWCPVCKARSIPHDAGSINHFECECFTNAHAMDISNTHKIGEMKAVQAYASSTKEHRPKDVDEMVEMFRHIYGARHRNISLELLTFHFLEEVGEVTEELGRLQVLDSEPAEILDGERSKPELIKKVTWELRKEIADVYSWIAAIVVHLDKIRTKTSTLETYAENPSGGLIQESGRLKLSQIIEERFTDGDGIYRCPTCNEPSCNPDKHELYW